MVPNETEDYMELSISHIRSNAGKSIPLACFHEIRCEPALNVILATEEREVKF